MRPLTFALTFAVLAANAPGQERAPTARIVSLPDSYAPDLGPGEVLVPGSVRDVVVTAYQAPPVKAAPPAMDAEPAPQATYAAPQAQYAAPSSSCYSQSYRSSYGAQAYSYGERVPTARIAPLPPAWAPTVLEPAYTVPAVRSGPALFRGRERRDFRLRLRSRGRGLPAAFGAPTVCGPGGCY